MNDKYEICRDFYNQYGRSAKMTFPEFLAKEISQTQTKMITIRQCFVNQVRLFEHGKKKHSESNLRRVRKREARVSKSFTGEVPIRSTGRASVENGAQIIQEVTTRPQLRDATTRKETVRYEPEPTRTSSRSTSGRKVRNKTVVIPDSDQDNEFEVVPLSPDKVSEKDAVEVQEQVQQEAEADTDEEEDKHTGLFDDLVPPKLPVVYEDFPVYTDEFEPVWQRALSLLPGDAEPIIEKHLDNVHQTPWLGSIHIPEMHRAN